jgi:hypothetical protein
MTVSRIRSYLAAHHSDEWEQFKLFGTGPAFDAIMKASAAENLSGRERADLGRICEDHALPDVIRRAAWLVVNADDRA